MPVEEVLGSEGVNYIAGTRMNKMESRSAAVRLHNSGYDRVKRDVEDQGDGRSSYSRGCRKKSEHERSP